MAIKTISIPDWMAEFLDLHPDLSLSKITQSKIIEIRERRRESSEEINKWKKIANKLQEELLKTVSVDFDKLADCIKESTCGCIYGSYNGKSLKKDYDKFIQQED